MVSVIKNPRILILVPARFGSTRFPGKPLAEVSGKPLVKWVWDNMSSYQFPEGWDVEVRIVTDDERIDKAVTSFEGKVSRVDDEVQTGTERIALAWEREFEGKVDLVINVQGDEPLLNGGSVQELAEFHLGSEFDIATMVHRKKDQEEKLNPNRVKAVFCEESKECLYFSRSPIPYGEGDWFLHVGVYSFRPEALRKFSKYPQSKIEIRERLEQVRALENGMSIGALETEVRLLGVDTPEDIPLVEGVLSGKNK